MHSTLTEAAKRALLRAAKLARFHEGDAVEPLHLLFALILDESRAAETLANYGLTRETIAAELPEEPDTTSSYVEVADVLDANVEVRCIVREAGGRARRAGEGDELNSEHMLWALTVVPSTAAVYLAERGIEPDTFGSLETTMGEPLAVDFEIRWGDAATPQAALRILDAAANRAREGLRVIEDFTRFELNDAHLTEALKTCRHELAAALTVVDSHSLAAMRDTPGDVGTAISTESESRRATTRDVVRANFKRVQEAVRSLEEFGKTISAEMGRRCEAVRYKLYTLEKAVLNTAANRDRLADCRLYLLLTQELCRHDPEDVLRQSLSGGVEMVQIREKSMSDRDLLAWAKRVREIAKSQVPSGRNDDSTIARSPQFIVNDRPDLALLSNADGVHVGQDELSVAECRRIVGPEMLIGVSTHTIEQARQAVLDGADYLGVGPVFPTGTKSFDQFPGLDFVRQVAAEISLPFFAIGGITPGRIAAVRDAGGARVAVSGAICASDDPSQAAAQLRGAL